MNTFTAQNVSEFIKSIFDHVPPVQELTWAYRGQADIDWELIPKAGRKEFVESAWISENDHNHNYIDRAIWRFELWREKAVAFIPNLPDNEFECLALAQHYGLATKLLDWSFNPLVGLFFACKGYENKDGCVYCYVPSEYVESEKAKLKSVNRIVAYLPRPFHQRIHVQRGVFTYHPNPAKPLERELISDDARRKVTKTEYNLEKIVIPFSSKPIISDQLHEMGINDSYLFPDLSGLSETINWQVKRLFQRKEI